jgi:hypothetical protein
VNIDPSDVLMQGFSAFHHYSAFDSSSSAAATPSPVFSSSSASSLISSTSSSLRWKVIREWRDEEVYLISLGQKQEGSSRTKPTRVLSTQFSDSWNGENESGGGEIKDSTFDTLKKEIGSRKAQEEIENVARSLCENKARKRSPLE